MSADGGGKSGFLNGLIEGVKSNGPTILVVIAAAARAGILQPGVNMPDFLCPKDQAGKPLKG